MQHLRTKAHTCFEMSAKARSMTFATIEAEIEYQRRIVTVFHEFVKEFVEDLAWKQKDKYGILLSNLSLCLTTPPILLQTHAQMIEARYDYYNLPSFDVSLKHKELRINDLNSKGEAVFTLEF